METSFRKKSSIRKASLTSCPPIPISISQAAPLFRFSMITSITLT